MRILVVGSGGVGSAMAAVAQRRTFFEHFTLADGTWKGNGVLGPEAFDAVPFVDRMSEAGWGHGVVERSMERVS